MLITYPTRLWEVSQTGLLLNDVRQAALNLRLGGVGYYPDANFVHLDSGRFRFW
ncbi:MAG: DUF882 domain-containing protein [Nitrospirae bacterium]|nr:DUF882 domain-containing protein [Nitrospirota bacterium]